MTTQPTTPHRDRVAGHTTPAASRVAGTHIIQSSPHYTTTRRHALYGTEDRIVIDPGSRIWKVGFSGEGKPRDVFYADGGTGECLWDLRRASDPIQRAEEDKILEVRLETSLRAVFHSSLMTDPKSRKVILAEHPFLPLHIKDTLARVLFQNLQVPSISFANSHLLSLFGSGRITGLVLDSGHHESVALPIFAARPLYSFIQTTPLAGSRLTSHLRALLLFFGTYFPPPAITGAVNVPAANRATRIPEEVLTDAVIEEIKTRCCCVGEVMESSTLLEANAPSPADNLSELEVPPSDAATSESEFSHVSSQPQSSEFSVVTNPLTEQHHDENHLQSLATLYKRHSTATDLQMRVLPASSTQIGPGRATLIIPGWIRERAAEVLFEGGDVDECSVAEVILDALLHVPVDLRKTLASSILIVGGTPMLPGFIPRLHAELLRAITPHREQQHADAPASGRLRPKYDRYAALRPLLPYFAIVNNPAPPVAQSERARISGGKAPAFTPSTMAWVGGSLAGALKTGGVEVLREHWDESELADRDPDESMDISPAEKPAKMFLPDWTRMPLSTGAPPAVFIRPAETAQVE